MTTDAMHAWLLHKRWVGDTSVLLTFVTDEQGILSALYRGGRTAKIQTSLQAFTPMWLAINRRANWTYVRRIETLSSSLVYYDKSLFSALYVNELMYTALRPGESFPEFYAFYEDTLRALVKASTSKDLEIALRLFERSLLSVCGYHLSLTHDRDEKPLIMDKKYGYVVNDGFYPAEKGLLGKNILAFSAHQFDDEQTLKTAKWLMRRAIEGALDGKPVKARALYTKTNQQEKI